MISIVVCHRDKKLLKQFKENVEKTIGINFEFVIVDNTNNDYTIFEAYNLGIRKSKYDCICFAHEDLLFHTPNWGEKVVAHLADENTGMIGVVGGNCFPNCPSPWWNNTLLNDPLINNIQHWDEGFIPKNNLHKKPFENKKNVTRDYQNPTKNNKVKAVALDGLWMCAHRRVLETCKFDEQTFKGFHCYDTDFCFQVLQNFDIYVVYDILIEHLSMGTVAKQWALAADQLASKWLQKLPFFAKEVDSNIVLKYNTQCLLTYCYWMQSMNFSDNEIKIIIKKYLDNKYSIFKSEEYMLLNLWSRFGFKSAKIIFKLLKNLIK